MRVRCGPHIVMACLFALPLLLPLRLFAVPVSFGISVPTSATTSQTTAIAALEQAKTTGADYVRVAADWPRIMPRAAGQNFAWLDAIVQAAIARHLKVILVLGPSPRWSVSYLDTDSGDEEILRAHPDLPAYRAYVTALARHFQSQVTLYQLWQRPCCTTLLADASDVYALYREGARAVHAVNPALQVLAPEPGNVDLTWLKGYVQSVSGSERPDGIVLAPVSFATKPEIFAMRTQVLQRHILTRTVSPALWADISLDNPTHNPHQSLEAMALMTGCHHLVFTASSDTPACACLQSAATFIRPLCGQEYTGWSRTADHCIGCAFSAADAHSLLLFPQADAQLSVFPGANPREGAINAQQAQITCTLPDCQPTVQQVAAPITLEVSAEHPMLISGVISATSKGFPDISATPLDEDTVTLDTTGTNPDGIYPLPDMPGGQYKSNVVDERTILRTTSTMPWIYFSVPTRFLFFNIAQVPVDITVQVMGVDAVERTGFNIYYDALDGMRTTKWQWIDVGSDKVFSYTFRINDALFAGNGGYDFRIQRGGSKENLRVVGVSVKKATATKG